MEQRIKSAGVYAITNLFNDSAYIGSTKDFKVRWDLHRSSLRLNKHSNSHLQHSWNKYGENKFEFMVCEYVNDFELLVDREQYWLDFHRMHVGVYNIILVVDRSSGMLGKKHSKETRQQMSISAYNRPPVSDESRRRNSESNLGRTAWNKGKTYSREYKQRLSEVHRGNKHTKESKCKMSDAQHNMSPEAKAEKSRKVSEANGKPYPAFIHKETGEIIPAGVNLNALCRSRGFGNGIYNVKNGKVDCWRGWMLLKELMENDPP